MFATRARTGMSDLNQRLHWQVAPMRILLIAPASASAKPGVCWSTEPVRLRTASAASEGASQKGIFAAPVGDVR